MKNRKNHPKKIVKSEITDSEDEKDPLKIEMESSSSGKEDAEDIELSSEMESDMSDDSEADSQQNVEQVFVSRKTKRGRSKGQPYRSGYKVETLKVAYEAVVDEGLSVYSAAKKYNVPQSTLRDRVLGRVSAEVTSSGPPTIFTPDEEAGIAAYVKIFSEIGHPLSRLQVRELAGALATQLERRDFSGGRILSLRWYYKLVEKFPDMQMHKFAIPKLQEISYGYYKKLMEVYETYDFANNAKRIFSLDAVSVHSDDMSLKMICRKVSDENPDVSVFCKDAKITLLCCASATGKKIPPCFVFRNENEAPSRKNVNKIHRGATIKISENDASSELDPRVLGDYFESHFSQHEKLKGSKYLLFYDSQRFKVSLHLWLWGRRNNLMFFPLPITRPSSKIVSSPTATGCLYGVDSMFETEERRHSEQNKGSRFTVLDACRSLNRSYICLSPSHLEQVFLSMGVFPLPENNPGILAYDKLIVNMKKDGRPQRKTSKKNGKKKKKKSTSLTRSPKLKKQRSGNKRKALHLAPASEIDETAEEDLDQSSTASLHKAHQHRRRSRGAKKRRVDTTPDAADPRTRQFIPIDWTGVLAPPNEADRSDEGAADGRLVQTLEHHQNATDVKNVAGVSLESDTEETATVDDCTYYVYLQTGDDDDATQTSIDDSANMPVSVAEEVVIV